uniref:BRICHOS domain containing 5 n=1 Tax=Paramormyrops kingsleyae TaxID=1676925 RepID=A0A3B3RBP4_9TELE
MHKRPKGNVFLKQRHMRNGVFVRSLLLPCQRGASAFVLADGGRASRSAASPTHSALQVIRITALDGTGSLVNQSATVERRDSAVTYSVTSGGTNRTSTMLFDIRHGVICYKPDSQDTCFLRKMDSSDYENLQALLGDSTQKVSQFWFLGNETQRFTEFLEVLGGKPVDTASLPEPLQPLCLQSSTYWARKAAGPAKQRLIYFCIDICFPNNVCVSVCFYYLPE